MHDPSPAIRTPATENIDRSLKLSVVDGMMHAIMLGVSESYLGALAVELGHRDSAMALLLTVPILAGALTQVGTGTLVRWVGSRKRLVVLGATAQAMTHLAFITIAWLEVRAFWPLLLAKMVFWVSGMAIAPAWGAWMATLTQRIDRASYFARRSMLIYGALLPSFTLAGFALQRAQVDRRVLTTFGALFCIGFCARLLSARALAMQADPLPPYTSQQPLWLRLRAAAKASNWRIPIALSIFMMGAHVAVPFFTPYMLKTLALGYERYALLTAFALLAKALMFPVMHRMNKRFGLRSCLFASGLGVAVASYAWGHVTNWGGLVATQLLSGAAWSGVELASFQLLLLSAREEHHIELLSMATSLTGLLQLVGALGGSMLLHVGGLTYRDVFVVSGYARALPLLLLLPWLRVQVVPAHWHRLFMRLVSIRPGGGVVHGPITSAREASASLEPAGRAAGTMHEHADVAHPELAIAGEHVDAELMVGCALAGAEAAGTDQIQPDLIQPDLIQPDLIQRVRKT